MPIIIVITLDKVVAAKPNTKAQKKGETFTLFLYFFCSEIEFLLLFRTF